MGQLEFVALVQPGDVSELAGAIAWMPGNTPGTEWTAWFADLSAEFDVRIETTGPNFGFDHLLDEVARSRDAITFAGEIPHRPSAGAGADHHQMGIRPDTAKGGERTKRELVVLHWRESANMADNRSVLRDAKVSAKPLCAIGRAVIGLVVKSVEQDRSCRISPPIRSGDFLN